MCVCVCVCVCVCLCVERLDESGQLAVSLAVVSTFCADLSC